MSDGDKTVRVVSFQPRLRKDVEEAYKTKREVAIKNCSVKRNQGIVYDEGNSRDKAACVATMHTA